LLERSGLQLERILLRVLLLIDVLTAEVEFRERQLTRFLTDQAQLNHARCSAVVGLPYLKEVLDFLRDWEDKETKCRP